MRVGVLGSGSVANARPFEKRIRTRHQRRAAPRAATANADAPRESHRGVKLS